MDRVERGDEVKKDEREKKSEEEREGKVVECCFLRRPAVFCCSAYLYLRKLWVSKREDEKNRRKGREKRGKRGEREGSEWGEKAKRAKQPRDKKRGVAENASNENRMRGESEREWRKRMTKKRMAKREW